ncbi:UMP kinase [[Eubacterium] cellulosolvens]
MKITIKLGGFLFPREIDINLLRKYVKELTRLYRRGHHLSVITGGGEVARDYIEKARKLGATESLCDTIGIQVSHVNAHLLISGLGDAAYPSLPFHLNEALRISTLGKILVMGGLQPGQSTNAVAALIAEALRSDILINLTDVDGVYTSDPKIDPNAKRFNEVTPDQMMQLIEKKNISAGGYKLLDPIALRIINRSSILTYIINGKDITNLEKALKKKTIGTRIAFH